MPLFLKKHLNFKKLKKPSRWVILRGDLPVSFLISSPTKPTFYTLNHIKAIFFYIKKFLGRKVKRPTNLIQPRYWLTAKAKASRMGKGKGNLSSLIYYIRPGFKILAFPQVHVLALIRILRALRVRLPFKFTFFHKLDW